MSRAGGIPAVHGGEDVNLHVFDMDGTLLRGTTASLQIARHLGCDEELAALEARFAAGKVDTRGFSAAIHRLWLSLTPQDVADVVLGSPWLSGINEVCADIRRRGERSVVITMSPDFFARHLLEFGFDDVVASRFPALPFREPLDPAGILTPGDKVPIVAELCERYSLPRSRCVAYGDSMSDAPLFRELANTVAVNADHHLAELAALSYRGGDLAEAYALGRELLAEGVTPVRSEESRSLYGTDRGDSSPSGIQARWRHVGAADHHGDMLAWGGPVGTGAEGGDAAHGGGLGGNPQRLPQRGLRLADRAVIDKDDIVDIGLREGKDQVADPPGGQGIRRDASRGRVGRLAVGPGAGEGRRARRLDPDDADPVGEIGGYPRDQAASADRHEHGIQLIGLLGKFQGDAALPENGLAPVSYTHL